MPVNMDILLQSPTFDFWAVQCTFVPRQGAAFGGRGIYNTYSIEVATEDNTVLSDQRTIFDIRESEFPTMPVQDDHVIIPFDGSGKPLGEFQIIDSSSDGGGQTTLTLRKYE